MAYRQLRSVNGVLLLDKPVGATSNSVLQQVKRLFQAAKAGHTGSLDPLATGLLPLCFGEGTKMSSYLLDADKVYRLEAQFGVRTASGDAEAAVIARSAVNGLSARHVEHALADFRGDITQVPPMYSALKHNGKRLYDLARQGLEVAREPRPVTIFEFGLVDFYGDRASFTVHCTKGTYVRTLIDDLGEALGCGAHVTQLRRLGVGPFRSPTSAACGEQAGPDVDGQRMWTLQALEAAAEQGFDALDRHLLPIESVVAHWPRLVLSPDTAFYVMQGQAVVVPHAPAQGSVTLFDKSDVFLGVGEVCADGRIAPKRVFKPKRRS